MKHFLFCFVAKSDHCLVQADCSPQSSSRFCLADTREFGTWCYFHARDDLPTASQFLFGALCAKMAEDILCAYINKPKAPGGLFLELLSDCFFNKMFSGDEFSDNFSNYWRIEMHTHT